MRWRRQGPCPRGPRRKKSAPRKQPRQREAGQNQEKLRVGGDPRNGEKRLFLTECAVYHLLLYTVTKSAGDLSISSCLNLHALDNYHVSHQNQKLRIIKEVSSKDHNVFQIETGGKFFYITPVAKRCRDCSK